MICIEMYHSPDHDKTVFVLVDYKASSRSQVQEVYLWSTASGVNIQVQIRRWPDDGAVEL